MNLFKTTLIIFTLLLTTSLPDITLAEEAASEPLVVPKKNNKSNLSFFHRTYLPQIGLFVSQAKLSNNKAELKYGLGFNFGLNTEFKKNKFNLVSGFNILNPRSSKKISSLYLGFNIGIKKYFPLLKGYFFTSAIINPVVTLSSSPENDFSKYNIFSNIALGYQFNAFYKLYSSLSYSYGWIDIDSSENFKIKWNGFLINFGVPISL